MAEFLGVSKQAMVIRLKRLGLLKKDYLQNPYALADVERRMMIDVSICQYCRQVPGMWLARDGQGIAHHGKIEIKCPRCHKIVEVDLALRRKVLYRRKAS